MAPSTTSSSTSSSIQPSNPMMAFLPSPSAKQYINPAPIMTLQPLAPSACSPSSPSSSSSSSSCSSSGSYSAISSPPSDHGTSMQEKEAMDVGRATREYHAAVATWTAKTWQAVRFVIEQRSRHPAYNNTAPRQRSRSPRFQHPVENHTSLNALSAAPPSASSSFDSTPVSSSSSSLERRHTRDKPSMPALTSSHLSFSKKSTAAPAVAVSATPSSPSTRPSESTSTSALSALFASHASIRRAPESENDATASASVPSSGSSA